jgi:hypothetical protein
MPGPTYEEMLATGSLRLVESNELRSAVVRYYQRQASAATRDENAASGYRQAVRSYLPTSRQPLSQDEWERRLRGFGLERAAAALTQTEFAEAVNRHLNYWSAMGPTLEDLFERTVELITLIDTEIARLD